MPTDPAWLRAYLTRNPALRARNPALWAELGGDEVPAIPAVLHEERRQGPYWPYRSKLEFRYADWLQHHQQAGGIVRWRYEVIRLKLAPRTTLTVDWEVIMRDGLGDGRIQLHETKGLWHREDGWQKLKQAAALYPEFRFFLVQWKDEHWQWTEVPAA